MGVALTRPNYDINIDIDIIIYTSITI